MRCEQQGLHLNCAQRGGAPRVPTPAGAWSPSATRWSRQPGGAAGPVPEGSGRWGLENPVPCPQGLREMGTRQLLCPVPKGSRRWRPANSCPQRLPERVTRELLRPVPKGSRRWGPGTPRFQRSRPGTRSRAIPAHPGSATGVARRGRDTACPTGTASPERPFPGAQTGRNRAIGHSLPGESSTNTAGSRAGRPEPRAPSTYPCTEAIGGRG